MGKIKTPHLSPKSALSSSQVIRSRRVPESVPDVALRRRKKSLSASHAFPHGVSSLSGQNRPVLCVIAAKKVKTIRIKVIPAALDLCLVLPVAFDYFVADVERAIRSTLV